MKALPQLAKAATNEELQNAFTSHAKETDRQSARLEKVFRSVGESVRGKKSDGIIGIVEEAKTAIDEIEEGAVLDAALIAGGDRLDPIAPHRIDLVVAAIVLDVNDTGDFERDEPDHLGPAQEAGLQRTTAGYFMLLSTFDNCALDGGREAVLEHLEDDARRRRTDAVNARQDAGIEQIGQRTFESPYRGRRALVAPAALGRALDPRRSHEAPR